MISIHAALRRSPITRWISDIQANAELKQWEGAGRPETAPVPGLIKRQNLKEALEASGIRTVVETGTFLGDTTHALAVQGYNVISIEVEPRLAALARRRFASSERVQIFEGDSAVVLKDLVPTLTEPTLFWLDGHFSGGPTGMGELETPVVAEVECVLAKAPKGSVVYVDDARCFGVLPDYPTLPAFEAIVRGGGGTDPVVKDDCIRFTVGR